MQLGNNWPVNLEVRDDGASLEGYAAVFYREDQPTTEFRLMENVVERIMPGAFDGIELSDVRALFNHDSNKVLGRTSSGTLQLRVDNVGLRYAIQLPDTGDARDVASLVRRGDITGSSFGFQVIEQERREEGGQYIRELRHVKVADVGPVTFPAYEGTQAMVRNQDRNEALADLERWRQQRAKDLQRERDRHEARAAVVRLQSTPVFD